MHKILDSLTWGFLLVFFLPSVLVVASWNSLPGDSFYSVKLGMEQGLLALVGSYRAKGALEVKYTERRLAEAKQLLANRHSVEGLVYLNKQVVEAKTAILAAPDSTTKKQLAQQYVATLRGVSSALETQKQQITSPSSSQPRQGAPPRLGEPPPPRPTNAPLVPAATPTPTPRSVSVPPSPAPVDIGGAIGESQDKIDDAIKDLEKLSGSAQSQAAHERNDERKQQQNQGGNSGGNENRGNGNENRGRSDR